MRYLLLALVFLPLPASAFNVDELIASYHENSWYVGKGISPGDSFVYLVCDSIHYTIQHHKGCYEVRMDFYMLLKSENHDMWVLQAEITDAENTASHIFLMESDTLDIWTISGRDYADSISNTLFYLKQFTHKQFPQQLQIGENWGSVLSSTNIGTDLVVVTQDIIQLGDTIPFEVHILEYGLFESSTFSISKDIPFPITAVAYDHRWTIPDPPLLFSFELLEYTAAKGGSL